MSEISTTTSPVTVSDDTARADGARILKLAVDAILNRESTTDEMWASLAAEADLAADALAAPFVCTHGKAPAAPKHEPTCNTVREHDVSRTDAESAMASELADAPEKYRELIGADLAAKFAAEYDCNCVVSRKAARANGSSRGERKATVKMSAYIIDGAGVRSKQPEHGSPANVEKGPFQLRVVFAEPSTAERNFPLPWDKSDYAAIRSVKATAVKWASEHGATEGQVNAVIKAMTEDDYRVKA